MDVKELVEKYLKLRDRKAEIVNETKARVAKLDAAMDLAEAVILQLFDEHGVESMKTEFGTAYKSTRTSANVADFDALLTFIQEGEQWQFLERRVAKAAVEQYKEANGDLPPGVSWREEVTVNVRRN